MNLIKMALNFVSEEQLNGIEAALSKDIQKLKAETELTENESELIGLIREKEGKISVLMAAITHNGEISRILKTIQFPEILELVKNMK